jgi:alpha-ribazole phosphatase
LSRLLLVRHGETALNSSLRYWGKTDVDLGLAGLKQAERLRGRLAAERIDFAYSSQLKRAVITAETAVSNHKLNVIQKPELNEIDFGQIEGLNIEEISEKYPEIMAMWKQRDPALKYPDGESLTQMEFRVNAFINLLAGHSEKDAILIVSHSAILRTLICQLLGLEMSRRWSLRLDLASLSIIETYPGSAILCLFNDVSHLIGGF